MRVVCDKKREGQRRRCLRHRLKDHRRQLHHQAKYRAMRKGIKFDIVPEDIPELPTHCPILGIPIQYIARGKGGWYDDSPSLDRIVNELGYTKGNVRIISNRANRIKMDATLEELELVLEDARLLRH